MHADVCACMHAFMVHMVTSVCNSNGLEGLAWVDFAQVRIDVTYGQLYAYTQWSPVEIVIPTHWNVTERSVTTLLPVQLLSSIHPPPSSYYAFIPAKNNWAHIAEILCFLSFFFSLFLFHFLRIMKFCRSWSACIGSDTSVMWSHQAPHVGLLWKYKLNPKCNKRMAVLTCSFSYCVLVWVTL